MVFRIARVRDTTCRESTSEDKQIPSIPPTQATKKQPLPALHSVVLSFLELIKTGSITKAELGDVDNVEEDEHREAAARDERCL